MREGRTRDKGGTREREREGGMPPHTLRSTRRSSEAFYHAIANMADNTTPHLVFNF
jgi:hypothetical protein